MRSTLEQLERRLKTIIESSASLFGRTNRHDQIIRQLASSLYDQLPEQLTGEKNAPDQFTIYLHPDNIHLWQQPQWMEWLNQVICNALQDAGYNESLHPSIQLAAEASQPIDGLRITAVHSAELLGSTAAIPVSVAPSPPAEVSESLPTAYLIVQGSQTVPIDHLVFNIGRWKDNDLVLDDPRISRSHLQIRAIRGRFVLFDLNSTGGTLVNGAPIREHLLAAGDVILIGGISLIYGEDTPALANEPGHSTSPLGT